MTGHLPGGEQRGPWSDPDFLNKLLQSYGARTDAEPGISRSEQNMLQTLASLMEENRLEEAIQQMEEFARSDRSAAIPFTLGNLYWQNQQFSSAREAYQTALRKFPDFLRAHQNLGLLLLQKDQPENALPHLVRAFELGAREGHLLGWIAYTQNRLGNHLPAIAGFQQAILLEPDEIRWPTGLVQALMESGQTASAQNVLREIRKKHPANLELLRLETNLMLQQGNEKEALSRMELLLLMGDDKDPDLALTLANLYANRGMHEQALERFLQTQEIHGQAVSEGLLMAIHFFLQHGESSRADTLLQKVLPHADALPPSQQNLLRKAQAQSAKQKEDFDTAREIYLELSRSHPRSASIHSALAQLKAREGEARRAEIYWQRALEDPDPQQRAQAHMGFADFLVSENRTAEALSQVEEALLLRTIPGWENYRDQLASRIRSSP